MIYRPRGIGLPALPQRGLSRRTLLRAGAAASSLLGLPLLESLPRAQAQQSYPLRFVFVYNPNGTIQDQFWPQGAEAEAPETPLSGLTLPGITAALEPFKDRLLFLKGLDIKVSAVGPGGPHQRGLGGLLTGRELQAGDFKDGCGSAAGWANGISVDQEIARYTGTATLLPSLELGVRAMEADVRGRMSYAAAGNPLPPVNSPALAYERLFSSFTNTDPVVKAQRADVVAALYQQYGSLRPQLSVRDQDKVDQHLELLRGVERRMTVTLDGAACFPPEPPPALDENSETTMEQISSLQIALIASAFSCDLTRVATLQFSSAINEIRCPWLDTQGTGHSLSHSGVSQLEAQAALLKRSQWFAQQVANLLAALDAIPEGEGTVLDNSIVVWGNELGIGSSHTLTDIPFVLAGSAGGYLRTGRYLQYGGVAHNQLWVSVLNGMGIETSSFGHPDYGSGALPSLV